VALIASLPRVTTQAAFYVEARRVEWTIDVSGFTWAQAMSAAVEAGPGAGSVLSLSGRSTAWRSLLGPSRRAKAYTALVEGVTAYLARPPAARIAMPTRDEFRWWNGSEWSYEPPPP